MGSTLTNLVYHVVFSTKGRVPVIIPELRDEVHRYLGGIIKGESGIPLQINAMPDHVHMVLKLKPIHVLSEIMQKVKGSSSKWINEQKRLVDRFSWQEGYGAFTVSESQMARTLRAASSCCGFPSAFCPALRAWPSSGCSGQPSPRASSRVRQPLIRSTISAVIRYVREQEKHHQNLSFRDEFIRILKRHRVEYDERYIWT